MSKVSLIITVLNEEKNILQLLDALSLQTRKADEIIIVDGGSTDATQLITSQYVQAHPQLKISLLQKKGNRSVGRNEAIKNAQYEVLAITDAGCTPHTNWLEELLKVVPSPNSDRFVIAGYYDAQPRNGFQQAQIPYVLVMPDRVNPKNFLPATRSMVLTKNVWHELGGFDETLSDNEDYAFAKKLHTHNVPIIFTPYAKVTWFPRSTVKQFFWMIFRFARGDIFAGILRPKVLVLFARYLFGFFLISVLWQTFSLLATVFFMLAVVLGYSFWAVQKNKKYVQHGWAWLPVLQIIADVAVISGSLMGLSHLIDQKLGLKK